MSSPSAETTVAGAASAAPTATATGREWLEPDGQGGFASGTVAGERTRRYHALLLTATTPPTGRIVLVDGLDVWVETSAGTFALSSQRYAGPDGDVVHPDGASRIVGFSRQPWPTWRFAVPAGADGSGCCVIVQEIFAAGTATVVRWRVEEGSERVLLHVRPLLSGRDYHSLHHENAAFDLVPARPRSGLWVWTPYQGLPSIRVATDAGYEHDPQWYRNFALSAERDRGLDWIHDLASPGVFRFRIGPAAGAGRSADLVFSIDGQADSGTDAASLARDEQARRAAFADPDDRAADAYLVRRGEGLTVVAGYPWFTDWGRDTFIALRGLALSTGRLDDAGAILLQWADSVSEGMLPNRFADRGEAPEYNSVDASLWYIVAVSEYLALLHANQGSASAKTERDEKRLRASVNAILSGYTDGTRFGIRADSDGLLACGQAGVQLTWMDAKVGDWVVTPRIGKPVEVQALWLNALNYAATFLPAARPLLARGLTSFRRRFWNPQRDCLYDVVDCDHSTGTADASVRPNQIFAAGGLPLGLLGRDKARRVVDTVERELLTPLGLRSLARGEPGYRAHYRGGVLERDGAYHQGTVWPWLMGPFVEAWVRVRGSTPEARRQARERFLAPLRAHREEAGLGHISEVADAEAPYAPGGCPFQAWSLAELLRLERSVLVEPEPGRSEPS